MKPLGGIMPSLMARKGITGRASVATAFGKYFLAEDHQQASILMRQEPSFRNGITIKLISRHDTKFDSTSTWYCTCRFVDAPSHPTHPGLLVEIREDVGVTNDPDLG